jgi:hypothetical protein
MHGSYKEEQRKVRFALVPGTSLLYQLLMDFPEPFVCWNGGLLDSFARIFGIEK